ncbi:sensor histidine kinase [Variovorax boronicumulans]|uniref:sensor histidine kinase n=1 Tax=Variovorax boronicumulans TaxID=436515 RepID=UPI0033964E12
MRRLLVATALSLLGLLAFIGHAPAAGADAAMPAGIELRFSEATLSPDGLPTQVRPVQLPFRWDHAFPGRGGKASYRIELPEGAVPAGWPSALLLSGVGNQVAISLDGVRLASFGTLGDSGYDAAKGTQLVLVPASVAALHRSGQPQQLVIETTLQRQRGGGLASIRYGAEAPLTALYRSQQNWRHTSAIVYAVSLLLMGGLAGGLWLRQRDALYGCFALAALSGVARNLDRVWPEVPVPWPLWGAVVAVCYACHIALIARFVLLVLNRNPPWLVRAIYAALAVSVALACASFALARPVLWTSSLVILQLTSIVCLPYVIHGALVARRRIAGVLMAAGTLAILAGAHDLLLVRMGLFGGANYTLTPHAMFFFVMILAGLVVERYSRTVADYSALNANLAARVAEREEQLRGAFETVRQQQQEQAVLLERQRIMREIHDGVGSQLVGLLNVVTQPAPDRRVVEEHVKLALDEMRMAVDSLQPTQDDLPTVLATLRYRLQPRLDAAGIALVWNVAVIPPVAPFAAQAAMQLQRILLEAFTNVLKHAGATRIVMQVSWHGDETPPLVRIVLTDNGRGLPATPDDGRPMGHGIANMRSRAQAIGARLEIEAVEGPEGGTRVRLDWPCGPA